MKTVCLNSSARLSLLSLQSNAKLQASVHLKLSSGLKINSAIENPNSYYVASSLNNKSLDLSMLLDNLNQSIQVIKATENALSTALDLINQFKSNVQIAIDENHFETSVSPPINSNKTELTNEKLQDLVKNTSGAVLISSANELLSALEDIKNGTSSNKTLVINQDIRLTNQTLTLSDGVEIISAQTLLDNKDLNDKYYVENNAKITFNFSG